MSSVLQAVGDALSGLLLVEYALCRLGWGLAQWTDLYTDLPSRQLKVAVPNRAAFTTTDAETRLMTPRGLQCQVEAEVAKVSQGGQHDTQQARPMLLPMLPIIKPNLLLSIAACRFLVCLLSGRRTRSTSNGTGMATCLQLVARGHFFFVGALMMIPCTH